MITRLQLAIFIIVAATSNVLRSYAFQCRTTPCYEKSEKIRKVMNDTVDVCQIPQVFFCGNWLESFKLPDDESHWTSALSDARNSTRQQLKRILEDSRCVRAHASSDTEGGEATHDDMLNCYYQSCMDTDRMDKATIEPLIRQMKSFAPFLYKRASQPHKIDEEGARLTVQGKSLKLAERLSQLWINMGVTSFINLSVKPSAFSTARTFGLHLSGGGLTLESRQYEQTDTLEAYLELTTSLLTILTVDVQSPKCSWNVVKQGAERRASAVLRMEQDLRHIQQTPQQRDRVKSEGYKKSNWEVSKMLEDALDFDNLLYPIWEFTTAATHKDMNQVIVDNPMYISELATSIKKTWSWGEIHDYLLIRTILHFIHGLPKPYQDAYARFQSRLLGVTQVPRWRRCQELINTNLGWILGKRYVNSVTVPQRNKVIADTLIVAVKGELGKAIDDVNWLNANEKIATKAKLTRMTHKLGYPDWLLANSAVYFNRYYGDPNVIAMRDFVTASAYLSNQQIRFELSRLSQPKDTLDMGIIPQEATAYFTSNYNQFIFPLALLQEPFIHIWTECGENGNVGCLEERAYMKLLTYGAIGSIIGRDLSRFLDTWRKDSAPVLSCLSNQYSKYGVKLHRPRPSPCLDTYSIQEVPARMEATLEEHIVVSRGINLAYRALNREHPSLFANGVDSARLFIQSFAQLQCEVIREKALLSDIAAASRVPNSISLYGTLANFGPFSLAFTCNAAGKKLYGLPNAAFGRSLILNENGMSTHNRHFDQIIFDPFDGIVTRNSAKCNVW